MRPVSNIFVSFVATRVPVKITIGVAPYEEIPPKHVPLKDVLGRIGLSFSPVPFQTML